MSYTLFEVQSGAFVFNDKNELFLLKNKLGTWGIVGGHLEKGETIEACLIREIKEETQMNVKIISQIGMIQTGNSFIVRFAAKYLSGKIILQKEEALDYKWVALEELKKYNLTFEELPNIAKNALKKILLEKN
jgi:NADH pyrophosphatase NudC (nudix superfamily)